MRRYVLLALVLLAGSASAAVPDPVGTVLPPLRPGHAHEALLVLFPPPGGTAGAHADVARAAQEAAPGVRLWVAVAEGGTPADVPIRYRLLLERAQQQGFRGAEEDAVVVGWGEQVRGTQLLQARGSAAVGTGQPLKEGTLRVLAELDRGTRVVRAALDPAPLLVLPGATAEDLSGPGLGPILSDLVRAVNGDPDDLETRLQGDRLVGAVGTARDLEAGDVCAALQRETADLAASDAHRLTMTNRADPDLMAPTPEGVAASDLGGFLYGKAQLVDEGDSARVVTSSYTSTVAADGPALEVMCKTKSRSAVAQAVYGDHERVDPTPPTCAGFTAQTLAWAREQLSPQALARSGGVAVLPDAAKSAGPEWVFSPLVLAPADPMSGGWQVQSPSLVTELSDTQLDPEFAGNHYCKVLSPVRALELLLEDTAR